MERGADLRAGDDSIVMYEEWLETRDQARRATVIAEYNEEDCALGARSARLARARAAARRGGVSRPIPWFESYLFGGAAGRATGDGGGDGEAARAADGDEPQGDPGARASRRGCSTTAGAGEAGLVGVLQPARADARRRADRARLFARRSRMLELVRRGSRDGRGTCARSRSRRSSSSSPTGRASTTRSRSVLRPARRASTIRRSGASLELYRSESVRERPLHPADVCAIPGGPLPTSRRSGRRCRRLGRVGSRRRSTGVIRRWGRCCGAICRACAGNAVGAPLPQDDLGTVAKRVVENLDGMATSSCRGPPGSGKTYTGARAARPPGAARPARRLPRRATRRS